MSKHVLKNLKLSVGFLAELSWPCMLLPGDQAVEAPSLPKTALQFLLGELRTTQLHRLISVSRRRKTGLIW